MLGWRHVSPREIQAAGEAESRVELSFASAEACRTRAKRPCAVRNRKLGVAGNTAAMGHLGTFPDAVVSAVWGSTAYQLHRRAGSSSGGGGSEMLGRLQLSSAGAAAIA